MRIAAASLPLADWVHVINAVDSSAARKAKRGDGKRADEMAVIRDALIRQFKDAVSKEQQCSKS